MEPINEQTEQGLYSEKTRIAPHKKRSWRRIIWFFCLLLGMLFVGATGAITYLNLPTNISLPTSFTVESGSSVRQVTTQLEEAGLVRSDTFLYLVIVTFFDPTTIKASTYVIDEPLSTFELAKQLVKGDFDNDLIRFTHIEGETVSDLADKAEREIKNFNKANFIEEALPLEGKLFPDTYFIPETFTASELVALLYSAFLREIEPYEAAILESSLSLEQILVLASIVEREANTPESMKIVAGIYQNRLRIGMPLQADASIEYVLDKALNELTAADLEIDSPYNTYLNPGLPPTPIGNPGLDSITAVLNPTESEYFYYITDENGKFHYSRTYSEHLDKVQLYLR